MTKYKVEGVNDLYVTPENAIINENTSEYQKYIQQREISKQNKDKLKSLEAKIDTLTEQFQLLLSAINEKQN